MSVSDHASGAESRRSDETVEMQGITRWFGSLLALDDVDLTLRPGEIHGLLGENGAGKSTLMGVLSGSIRPDRGSISVGCHAVIPGSPSRAAAYGIGIVHQHFSLVPALTVAENLSLAAVSGPALYSRRANLAPEALKMAESLGWHFDPETPVWQLAIGRQQRLEIVKLLARNARWLLLDEPTAVLSPPEAEELFSVLERLRGEGRGVVFITHKLHEVQRLCDRVTVLRRGRRVGEAGRNVPSEALARMMIGPSTAGLDVAETPPLTAHSDSDPTAEPAARSRDEVALPHTMGSTAPALIVRDLWVRDARGGDAVRGLSFDVTPGEIFGVAGVDGNGQAELAEAIVGLRPVVAGTLSLRNEGNTQRAGYVPPDRRRTGLILPLSVHENLALEIASAPEHRIGPFLRHRRLRTATRAMTRRFDIRAADEQQPVADLSGGNQQKIVLARALSGRRTLLVAVNPTRGLDVSATRFVHAQLRAAREAGVGVLLVSTELDELVALSDRIGVLYEGRWQGIVTPTESRDRIGLMMGGAGGASGA